MKKLTLLLLLGVLAPVFTSCLVSYPKQYQDLGKLIEYPIIPHQNEVEVFFAGEQPRDTAYIKLRVIDMYGSSYTTTGEMIQALQREAQRYGADALLIGDDKTFTNYFHQTWERNRYSSYAAIAERTMYAVAIKYKRNIKGVEKFIGKQLIFLYDSATGNYQPIVEVKVDTIGNAFNIKALAKNKIHFYHQYIQRYSLAWLAYDKSPDWKHDGYGDSPTAFAITRVYKSMDWEQRVKAVFQYPLHKRIDEISLRQPSTPKQELKFSYATPKTKQPQKLEVWQGRQVIYQQLFEYDSQQNLTQSFFYKHQAGQNLPFLKVEYVYLRKEDF